MARTACSSRRRLNAKARHSLSWVSKNKKELRRNEPERGTTTRDSLFRLFLVGLALLLRNLWQLLTYLTLQERKRQQQRGDTLTALPRFKDILQAFALVLCQK